MEVDHIGIATEDAAELAATYGILFDAPVVHEERFEGIDVVFLKLGGGYIELLEPIVEGTTIDRYLDTHGPGIHHLALKTEEIKSALQRAQENGVELIDEEPRPGAWNHQVAFLHPKSTGGVLIEYVERA